MSQPGQSGQPAQPPPPPPNGGKPQEITEAAKVCIAVTTILGVVAIIAVAMRFYTRIRVQRIKLGADDWVMLVAMVSPRER